MSFKHDMLIPMVVSVVVLCGMLWLFGKKAQQAEKEKPVCKCSR